MPLPVEKVNAAEARFRAAFQRLKNKTPHILKPGASVSQNNVAKEAECDPSALRKSRYPELINEIQGFINSKKEELPTSTRQDILKKRRKNRTLRQAKSASDLQRDTLASQLLCANVMIIELTCKLTDALAKLENYKPSAERFPFSTLEKTNPKATPYDVSRK